MFFVRHTVIKHEHDVKYAERQEDNSHYSKYSDIKAGGRGLGGVVGNDLR